MEIKPSFAFPKLLTIVETTEIINDTTSFAER